MKGVVSGPQTSANMAPMAAVATASAPRITLQRKCAECEEEEKKKVQRWRVPSGIGHAAGQAGAPGGPRFGHTLSGIAVAAPPGPMREVRVDGSGDAQEAQAERVAGQVMNARPGHSEALAPASRRLQALREPAMTSVATMSVPAPLHADLESSSGGVPLPAGVLGFMEPRFGHDFSHVRVHADGRAAELNRHLHARAFTRGTDIWLGQGESVQDRHLMAHELAHVVQQGVGTPARVQRFPLCRHLLDAPETTFVSENSVRDEIYGDLRGRHVAREFSILGASAAPQRTENAGRGGKRGGDVIRPQVVGPNIYGRADIALLNGTVLELMEVKRAWFFADTRKRVPSDGIEFAEKQVETQVEKGREELPGINERWQSIYPQDKITGVKAMPMARYKPITPRRVDDTPTSLAWCRDGVMSFKAIGDRDPDTILCGVSDQGRIDAFLDRALDPAQKAIDDYVDNELLAPAEARVKQMSIREALRFVLQNPEIRSRVPGALLAGDEILIELLAPQLERFESEIRAAAASFVRRVIARLRKELQNQARQLLAQSFSVLCTAAAVNTAVLMQDLMKDFNRRMRAAAAALIPVLVATVAAEMVRELLAALAKAMLEALAIVAVAVALVIGIIVLWEFVVAAGIGAAIEAAIAAMLRAMVSLIPALA